jgi:large subunit ribosomal protein L19
MQKTLEKILKPFLKTNLPDVKPGDTVKVYQKIKELIPGKGKKSKPEERERIQVFEGVVLSRKHGKGISSTITVRRIIGGVGVERIFPLHLPSIEKIEIVSRAKVRRAKLYYLRERIGKKAKLKRKESFEPLIYEAPTEAKDEKKEMGGEKKKIDERKNETTEKERLRANQTKTKKEKEELKKQEEKTEESFKKEKEN